MTRVSSIGVSMSSVDVEIRDFNSIHAEVTVRGTLTYQGLEYQQLPIVRLTIWRSDPDDLLVVDEFSRVIPYLKPVSGFRAFLMGTLQRKLTEIEEGSFDFVVVDGIRAYIAELNTFQEARSLLRQAKQAVNELKPDKPDSARKALKVLEALEVNPCNHQYFGFTR